MKRSEKKTMGISCGEEANSTMMMIRWIPFNNQNQNKNKNKNQNRNQNQNQRSLASLSSSSGSLSLKKKKKGKACWEKENGGEDLRVLALMHISLAGRAVIGALSGGLAGGLTSFALHPIDTVKTKLQTRGASALYRGPADVLRKVVSEKGISGLYSGVHAAFIGSIVSSSVYFGTYELIKGSLAKFSPLPVAFSPPIAAALGNITSSAVLVPKEVVKQRMQAGAVGSAREIIMGTLRHEGIAGLYVGYSAALLRNLPTNIINFSTFEYLKLAWLQRSGRVGLSPAESIISGALAGALSAALTTPLDVVKTRLMTQARKAVLSAGLSGTKAEASARAHAIAAYTYSGVSSTLRKICKEEGASALMSGIVPRVFYSACFSALGFSAFEMARTFLLIKHFELRNCKERVD